MVRALASHYCSPGSIPGLGVRCGLSCCRFSSLFRGFFSGYSGFPLSSKTNISKFQFDLDAVDEEPPCGCATANSHLFFYLNFLLLLFSSANNKEIRRCTAQVNLRVVADSSVCDYHCWRSSVLHYRTGIRVFSG